jgi:hypothetical protein
MPDWPVWGWITVASLVLLVPFAVTLVLVLP